MVVVNKRVGLVDFVRDDVNKVVGIRLNVNYDSQLDDGAGGTILHTGYTATFPYWDELSVEDKATAQKLFDKLKIIAESSICPEV